jgi:hypothetical protein
MGMVVGIKQVYKMGAIEPVMTHRRSLSQTNQSDKKVAKKGIKKKIDKLFNR